MNPNPDSGEALARGLGWFSIGLGLVETLATDSLARALGMEQQAKLIRAYGVRELANGAAILSQPKPSASWLWARVGGDALDITTLAAANLPSNPKRAHVAFALANVAAVTLLDVVCAVQLQSKPD